MQSSELYDSLEHLRAMAREPVDARLERANGMATLVQVSPQKQEELARSESQDLQLELQLAETEPIPQTDELRVLSSAGIRFEIVEGSASVTERTVRLRAVKCA